MKRAGRWVVHGIAIVCLLGCGLLLVVDFMGGFRGYFDFPKLAGGHDFQVNGYEHGYRGYTTQVLVLDGPRAPITLGRFGFDFALWYSHHQYLQWQGLGFGFYDLDEAFGDAQGHYSSVHRIRLDMPYITLAAVLGLLAAGIWGRLLLPNYQAWRRARMEAELGRMGQGEPEQTCAVCGYDMRATPDRCPECGTLTSQVLAEESIVRADWRWLKRMARGLTVFALVPVSFALFIFPPAISVMGTSVAPRFPVAANDLRRGFWVLMLAPLAWLLSRPGPKTWRRSWPGRNLGWVWIVHALLAAAIPVVRFQFLPRGAGSVGLHMLMSSMLDAEPMLCACEIWALLGVVEVLARRTPGKPFFAQAYWLRRIFTALVALNICGVVLFDFIMNLSLARGPNDLYLLPGITSTNYRQDLYPWFIAAFWLYVPILVAMVRWDLGVVIGMARKSQEPQVPAAAVFGVAAAAKP